MTRNSAKVLIFVLIAVLVCISAFFVLSNLKSFKLAKVSIVFDGPVSDVSDSVKKYASSFSGKSILNINCRSLEKKLCSLDCVSSADVTKEYPSKLQISVSYRDFDARIFVKENGKKVFYLASTDCLYPVDEDTYNLYSPLHEVEISSDYAVNITKWGVDEGFVQMLVLAGSDWEKTLITDIKYVNNKASGFGLLEMYFSSSDVKLNVKEPVTVETLLSAFDEIENQYEHESDFSCYDLYSSGLSARF